MSKAHQEADHSREASKNTAVDKLIDKLLEFEPVDAPVISLYLDARVNENGKHDFFQFVRHSMNERAKTFEAASPERASFEEDFVRITRYLEAEVDPASQGLAIFACSSANDYFEVGQFKAPFQKNRLLVYERPHIYPLARLNDQYRRYAVLLADTNRAQIFVVAAGETTKRRETKNVKTKHSRMGGWSQSRYQRHTENYHLHHAKEVVDVLERTIREEGIQSVILAGDEDTVIPLLREQMSKELNEKVVDVLKLGIDTPEHELLEDSLKAFRVHDSLEDMQKVEQFLGEFRGDNLAVAGVADTLVATSNGQVEELLISTSPESLEYDETEVVKVLRLYDGEAAPASVDRRQVADQLVRRARELSSARITFVEDATRLEQVGGVGALLRYRTSQQSAAPYEAGNEVSRSQALTETR